MDLYFECDIHEKDIQAKFKDNAFLTNIFIAWSKLNKNHATVYYSNEILWNNSNIKAGNRKLLYKNWLHTGIKNIKDIYDYSLKKIYSFEELTGLYNLPRTDFLKYISLVQSIPNQWKAQLKQENRDAFRAPTVFDQLQKAKQRNKLVYNTLLNSEEVEKKKSEQKWNECFLGEELNWKDIYCTTHTTINEIKIRDFQYKYLKRIIPTNQF